MEVVRSFSKRAFVKSLQQLIPEITGDDVIPTHAGVRAQALLPSGQLVDDFLFEKSEAGASRLERAFACRHRFPRNRRQDRRRTSRPPHPHHGIDPRLNSVCRTACPTSSQRVSDSLSDIRFFQRAAIQLGGSPIFEPGSACGSQAVVAVSATTTTSVFKLAAFETFVFFRIFRGLK